MTPPPPTLPALLTELVPALEHIHGLHLVHRDLKPENILLRSREPLDLVLADFGLVRLVEGSVHLSRGEGTDGYLPPEADLEEAEVTPAWDWWSLGIICAELAGGRHPFAQADGTMVPAAQIRRHFAAQRPVPLEHLADPRERLLCRGLLIADREQRWGAREVRAWLAGESPEVPEAVAAPGTRTVLFAGRDHESARALAAAFQEHWEEALRRLFQERDALLVEELTALLREEGRQEALTALSEQLLPAEVGVRFARLLLEMDPQLAPRVGPLTATPAGLGEAARRIARDAAGSTELKAALRELRRCAVLRSWRGLPGMARGPEIEGAWLALIAAWEALPGGLPGERPDPGLAAAWLLLVALDPERRSAELRAHVQAGAQTAAADCPPWAALAGRTDDPVALVAAMLTQGAAEMRGRELLAEREAQRRAEEERRRAAAEARRVAEAERRRAEEKAAEERRRAEENARRAEEQAADRAAAAEELAALVAAWQRDWDAAASALANDPAVVAHVDRLLARAWPGRGLTIAPVNGGSRYPFAHVLLLMNPNPDPLVGPVRVTREGLAKVAAEVVADPRGAAASTTALRTVLSSGALGSWSKLPGCEHGAEVEQLWRRQSAEWDGWAGEVRAAGYELTDEDRDRAFAWILLLLVAEDAEAQLERLRSRVQRAAAGAAGASGWWRVLTCEASSGCLVLAVQTQAQVEWRWAWEHFIREQMTTRFEAALVSGEAKEVHGHLGERARRIFDVFEALVAPSIAAQDFQVPPGNFVFPMGGTPSGSYSIECFVNLPTRDHPPRPVAGAEITVTLRATANRSPGWYEPVGDRTQAQLSVTPDGVRVCVPPEQRKATGRSGGEAADLRLGPLAEELLRVAESLPTREEFYRQQGLPLPPATAQSGWK